MAYSQSVSRIGRRLDEKSLALGSFMKSSRKFQALISSVLIGLLVTLINYSVVRAAYAAGRETRVPDVQFQPIRPPKAVTIREAVDIAIRNFPAISHKQYKLRASLANVALAKTQYLPNLNIDIQESEVTANRIASVVMNNVSGFDTVPVDAGPSSASQSARPIANNLDGVNLNWLLVDFGLRHANDAFAYADARSARADLNLTRLDVAFDAADAFLAAAASKQAIKASQAAFEHMVAADIRAKTLVSEGLRPGVDAADFDFEVSRTKISLIKAEKEKRLALVELAEKMGVANMDLDIISDPILRGPTAEDHTGPFDLSSHPVALLKTAEINRWRAKEDVLDRAYRPHLWLNSSVWGKGSGEPPSINPVQSVGGGFLPQSYDYMVGLSFSFPVMEYFPLKAQKRIAFNNEMAAKADYDLAIQILEKKDARARILLSQARKVADETPILVQAAKVREIKVLKRYSIGLANMVAVAQAEKSLADAQVEDALAQIEVWRSILALSYAQGDIRPFLQLVALAEGSTSGTATDGR
jgi:outer membrane protein TolC